MPLLKIVVGILVVLLLGSIGMASYVGWQLTHPVKKALAGTPADLQIAYEDVTFESRHQAVQLSGWYMKPEGADKQLTVIVAHGYRQNREQDDVPTLEIAKQLVKQGYGVLAFDFRNSGESEGKLTSVGQFEKYDLLGAIDWVKQEHQGQIALLGFSMGATTSLLAAAEEPAVAGMVVDSPFSQLRTYLMDNLSVWSGLPEFPFTPLIMSIIPVLTGLDVDEVDAVTAVEKIYPRPILFIHGMEDSKIPFEESKVLWEKHPEHFQYWQAPKGDHMDVYKEQTEEYMERLLKFLDDLVQ